jgi:hypothetical protein
MRACYLTSDDFVGGLFCRILFVLMNKSWILRLARIAFEQMVTSSVGEFTSRRMINTGNFGTSWLRHQG